MQHTKHAKRREIVFPFAEMKFTENDTTLRDCKTRAHKHDFKRTADFQRILPNTAYKSTQNAFARAEKSVSRILIECYNSFSKSKRSENWEWDESGWRARGVQSVLSLVQVGMLDVVRVVNIDWIETNSPWKQYQWSERGINPFASVRFVWNVSFFGLNRNTPQTHEFYLFFTEMYLKQRMLLLTVT